MKAQYIESHFALAKDRFLAQYVDAPNFNGLMAALCQGVQRYEDAVFAMPAASRYATATGMQLDDVGNLVGIARNGLADDAYRLLINGTIAANWGIGTVASLQGIAQQLYAASQVAVIGPLAGGAPATVTLQIGSPTTPAALWPLIEGIVARCVPAGVTLLQVTTYDAAGELRLAGPGPGLGLGDFNDATVGGQLAGILFQ